MWALTSNKPSKRNILARSIREQQLCSILAGCVSLQRRILNVIPFDDHENISVLQKHQYSPVWRQRVKQIPSQDPVTYYPAFPSPPLCKASPVRDRLQGIQVLVCVLHVLTFFSKYLIPTQAGTWDHNRISMPLNPFQPIFIMEWKEGEHSQKKCPKRTEMYWEIVDKLCTRPEFSKAHETESR